MECWNRYRVPGTIFDFGCTDSVGPELGHGLRNLIGAPPVAAPKVDRWTGSRRALPAFTDGSRNAGSAVDQSYRNA